MLRIGQHAPAFELPGTGGDGVGTDSAYSHLRFADAEDVGFPLLSDADGRVCEAYGVRVDELEGHRGVAAQALFVVDPDRTIQYAWRGDDTDDPDDVPDFDAVETAVRCRDDTRAVPGDADDTPA